MIDHPAVHEWDWWWIAQKELSQLGKLLGGGAFSAPYQVIASGMPIILIILRSH